MIKNTLLDEYKNELDILNYRHKQKIEEIEKELNNKGISIDRLNTLNNKYQQRIQELNLKEELNNKDTSLNEYKKRLNTLDNRNKQEIQELKKELEKGNIKNKNKVLEKINELNELNNKYKKEKRIIEQELNKKEQELGNDIREINDLKLIKRKTC